jgi:hypothetical protein
VIFDKKREYSKLRFKWRGLNEEFSELSEIEKSARMEFFESAMEYIEKNNLENPFIAKEESDSSGNKEVFQDDETKSIFRRAAIKSHPDKNGDEFVDVFRGIANAKNKGNLNQFLEEARKVKVKPDEISINQINVLEEEANELERKIDEIRLSVHWTWYHANNAQRQIILELVLNTQHA